MSCVVSWTTGIRRLRLGALPHARHHERGGRLLWLHALHHRRVCAGPGHLGPSRAGARDSTSTGRQGALPATPTAQIADGSLACPCRAWQGLKNITSDAGAKASFLQHLNAAAAGSDKTACDFAYTSNGKLQLPALNTPEWKPVMGGGASIGPKIDVVAPGGRSQTDNVSAAYGSRQTTTAYTSRWLTCERVLWCFLGAAG